LDKVQSRPWRYTELLDNAQVRDLEGAYLHDARVSARKGPFGPFL
jgi:hypothetical protein